MVKKVLKVFIKGILAGFAISLGGLVFIKTKEYTGNHVLGAYLFATGLILVCNFDYFLYTGKICYAIENFKVKQDLHYGFQLLIGYLGNLVGALITALLVKLTIGLPDFVEGMILSRVNDTWYGLIIKGFFCGILVYLAVEGFKKINNNFGKYAVLVLCIGGFIVCGFEHSIADAFYFGLSDDILITIVPLLLITLGNTLGGLILPFINLLYKEKPEN